MILSKLASKPKYSKERAPANSEGMVPKRTLLFKNRFEREFKLPSSVNHDVKITNKTISRQVQDDIAYKKPGSVPSISMTCKSNLTENCTSKRS